MATTIGTDTEAAVRITRTIAATCRQVFEAWTRPEMLSRWFGPKSHRVGLAEIDLRVGGGFRIRMLSQDDSEVHEVSGTYRSITPHTKLSFTWEWANPAHSAVESLVTVELKALGESTELTLVHALLSNQKERDSHALGWNATLDRLEECFA